MKLDFFPKESQLDMMDCGPACLKIIAKYYKKYYSLSFLRDKCGISKEGVSFLALSHVAEEIGFRTLATKCSVDDVINKIPLPAIIHWNNNHFVVVYGINGDRVNPKINISDPAKGLVSYTITEFKDKWIDKSQVEPHGYILILEPTADFKSQMTEDKQERRNAIGNLMGYFIPYKKNFYIIMLVMFIITALQALLPFISKSVIDIGIQTRDKNFIELVLIANVAIIVTITMSNAVRDWILMHLTARINLALISDYLVKLMKLPITFYENKMMGDILQRAQDHERIRSFIMNNSLNIIFSTLTFLLFTVILLTYNPIIFYIFLSGSIIYVVWVLAFLRIRKKLDWEYFELNAKNQSYWVETIGGIQDIKINNYEKARRWKWENIQARLYKVNIRVLNINNAQTLGAQFIDSLKTLFITFYCAYAVIEGEITFGVMISTQFIIGMLNGPVQQFIQFVVSFQFAKISLLRLQEIHQLTDEDEGVGQNDLQLPENKNIILNNVAFQYSPFSNLVLKGIKIVIPQGKVTAIVGDSGSGKSTLMKLLLRLYKPSFGEVMIGDMNINNISLRQWRDKCGAVMQDGKIFNDTILNNIILDDEKLDFKRLSNAVQAANIASEIERLPLGYQTKMGENGRGLSGGQKQRVLIARALYKDPDYLFFDEATNALDPINEQKIVASLDKIFHGKTVVVIAHRLSTIRKADQIIVMQNGMITEIGDHISLVKKQGRYFELTQMQENTPVIQ